MTAEHQYRVFNTNPDTRCGQCSFRGRRLNPANVLCTFHNDVTNPWAGCNKFRKDMPQRLEDREIEDEGEDRWTNEV